MTALHHPQKHVSGNISNNGRNTERNVLNSWDYSENSKMNKVDITFIKYLL